MFYYPFMFWGKIKPKERSVKKKKKRIPVKNSRADWVYLGISEEDNSRFEDLLTQITQAKT